MKRLWKILMVGALVVVLVLAATVFAAGPGYTDANGDGVCDAAGSGCQTVCYGGSCVRQETSCRYMDADGDGQCDRCGQDCPAGTAEACSGGHHGRGWRRGCR